MDTVALILAAGEGTRMKSKKPKVAHELLGKPLVRWAVDAAKEAGATQVVTVLGHGRDRIMPLVADTTIAIQEHQLGTGHAVMCAQPALRGYQGSLVVMSGDSPLIRAETIRSLADFRAANDAAAVVLTMTPPNNFGYGRILRDPATNELLGIVEQKDCTPQQREIRECNSGIYCFDLQLLLGQLDKLSTNNAQGEYYLTDVIAICREQGFKTLALPVDDYTEALGVNSRIQLAQASAIMQERINAAHMAAGVTMLDPKLVWIEPGVQIGRDTTILPMTFLQGKTTVGEDCTIGPNTQLLDCSVADGIEVAWTVAENEELTQDYLAQG
ncbi:MAG: NTP transferase domain-containing protein [Coriobacteriales bacterium]|nr:NTP transferase domain-containing protein [Coriobacteriales bacterium]